MNVYVVIGYFNNRKEMDTRIYGVYKTLESAKEKAKSLASLDGTLRRRRALIDSPLDCRSKIDSPLDCRSKIDSFDTEQNNYDSDFDEDDSNDGEDEDFYYKLTHAEWGLVNIYNHLDGAIVSYTNGDGKDIYSVGKVTLSE